MENLAYWIGGAVGLATLIIIIDQAFGFNRLDFLIKRKK